MRARLVIAISIASMFLVGLAHAGILGDVRSETRSGSSSSSSASSSDDDDGFSWGDDDDDYQDPNCNDLPQGCPPAEPITTRRYAPHPYASGSPGRVHIIEEDDVDPAGKRVAGTVTLDGAYVARNVVRSGIAATFMFRRVGLGLDFAPHLELAPLDALMLGSANALVAPILRPEVEVQLGLGLNAMIDGRTLPPGRRTDAAGLNFTSRLTVLPVRPLVLRARLDLGRLGGATSILFRTTAGLMIRRAEIFAGYESRRVGAIPLRGPTAGVRVWF